STYFGRRGNSKRPCDKLYDRYFNNRKGKNLPSCSNTPRGNDTSTKTDHNPELDEIVSKKFQVWLKYNDSPLEEIVDKWKTTHLYRKIYLKNSLERGETISAFIIEWPLYKHCVLGPQLINCDFDILYPNKGTNLHTKWEDFVPLIYSYYKKSIKDKVSREILIQLENENLAADTRNYIISLLLNAVITPVARYKNNSSFKRVTIQEGMDSFLVHVNSASNLEETLAEIRDRFSQKNNTLQPIIIATGSSINCLDNFFVYLDGTKLKFSSFLAALDLCFKVFQVFDVQYPLYCKGVWLFIQKFFF
ncbi:PREDICTED: uncharacterized protein LOC108359857, partial [Rhagoletis zephyria]|uniref:uncharacterized protein LOC108359857 n=1 Tax=Rhagoletis zephyria TaxID=28612 RepID=UPI000811213E